MLGLILRILDLIKSIFDAHAAAKIRKVNDTLAATLEAARKDDDALKASIDHAEVLKVEVTKAKVLLETMPDNSPRKVELQDEITTGNKHLSNLNDLLRH